MAKRLAGEILFSDAFSHLGLHLPEKQVHQAWEATPVGHCILMSEFTRGACRCCRATPYYVELLYSFQVNGVVLVGFTIWIAIQIVCVETGNTRFVEWQGTYVRKSSLFKQQAEPI